MSTDSIHHAELVQTPFYLGRHGESFGNAGDVSQGRGEDRPGEPNGLTPSGVMQVESAVPALDAAAIEVRYVSSSALRRAKESATVFIDASPDPKPALSGVVAPEDEDGFKEVSQKGWEGIYSREQTKRLREEKLGRFMGMLAASGKINQKDVDDYAAWAMAFRPRD